MPVFRTDAVYHWRNCLAVVFFACKGKLSDCEQLRLSTACFVVVSTTAVSELRVFNRPDTGSVALLSSFHCHYTISAHWERTFNNLATGELLDPCGWPRLSPASRRSRMELHAYLKSSSRVRTTLAHAQISERNSSEVLSATKQNLSAAVTNLQSG
jgi:hypothetical protein